MTSRTPSDPLDVTRARKALHAVAEYLMAGPQYEATGRIRLAVTPTGFATTQRIGPEVEEVAVEGGSVVVRPGGLTVPVEGTARELAARLGIAARAPDLYPDHAELGPDDDLDFPAEAGAVVLGAFRTGAEALRDLAHGTGEEAVLWPEHFDLALTIGEVNYGVSAGDAGHGLPYAYVGPWTPREGAFWNEPFGASRPVTDPAALAAFFREGRSLTEEG